MSTHIPVLLEEVLNFAGESSSEPLSFLDCTLGLGGHAYSLLKKFPSMSLIGIDQDDSLLSEVSDRLTADFPDRFLALHLNFSQLNEIEFLLQKNEFIRFDFIMADLGISSAQLDNPLRGLSFRLDAPLDMRLDQSKKLTAAEVVNEFGKFELQKIMAEGGVGSERRMIVSEIIKNRPITSTNHLNQICENFKTNSRKGVSENRSKLSALVFQALRMYVNQESEALSSLMEQAIKRLKPKGRMLVISFHSGEDKLVTKSMRWWGQMRGKGLHSEDIQIGKLLTPQAIVPTEEEIRENPRSRSARLRVFERNEVSLWTERSLVPPKVH